ncbi:TonB-dependent receptor [Mangrovimonas sp. TPBH4]|uniref:TonB-dependent receptor n=1 Tax=Mangrovimonas sp. TPBH4 TaxID=1645914 RepID=UPI0006B68DD1|nr:TonB-dependent receptor [Mangrovimonas sp. TPBH4]
MRQLLFVFSVLFTTVFYAQNTGSVAGKLTDIDFNNEPLAFANILIKGTTTGTTSDFDGLYAIDNLDPGSYTLVFSFVGYETQEITVEVVAGKVTEVNVPMGASAASLDEVIITTTTRKESEAALLLEQKKATGIKTSIGAQELSRKGVGDVATAVTKVSGISQQEGSGSVFVRGLGDRYNITTLNGLPLPSNNPANKNIDLDIFSTNIVEFIAIDKTYNAANYGDFAGANINIISKDYTGSGFLQLGLSSGANTEAIGTEDFYLHEGPNYSGFYTTDYPDYPLNNYNFTTSWDREKGPMPVNSGISLVGGETLRLGDETKLSFFGVGNYSNGFTYKEGLSRGGVNVSGVPLSNFDFENYEYKTNTTLMGNIGLKHKQQSIKYNVLYLNSTSQKQMEYDGVINVFDDAPEGGGIIQRSVFDRTELFVNQLLGDHAIGEQFDVNWGVSYNMLYNNVPNRRQTTLLPVNPNDPDGPKSMQLVSSASANHRFYQDLNEDELAANIATTFKFSKNEDDEYAGKVTLGYNGRMKKVDFEATQFNFRILLRDSNNNLITQPVVEPYNVDAYFTQENLNAGLFRIETFRGNVNTPNALEPQFYKGDQNIHAGFVNFEYTFSPKFSVIAGLRGEQITQTIGWDTSISSSPEPEDNKFDTFEILPAFSLKYAINEKHNLKFAASKTYTLPQFKERAPFLFQEVNQDYIGNPDLYASKDYNADIIWEFFPESDEIFSLGAFGKYILDPINQVTIASASNDISWVNSGDYAMAIGAELEVRKNLFKSEVETDDSTLATVFSAGLNAAYMYTDQELDDEKVAEENSIINTVFTNKNDRLSGASDFLMNADISFNKDFSEDRNFMTTLAFNYFSDRIYALGVQGRGNMVDKGYGTLDFITKYQVNEHITLGASFKNLLNPSVERYQDTQDVDVMTYKKGRDFKLSLSYQF